MSRSRILGWITLGFGILSAGSAMRSGAQIPDPVLAMSVRADSPGNSCDNAPPPCFGAQWAPTTGRYEFDLYLADPWSGGSNAARFCLHWPATWTYIDAEMCTGSLASGELGVSWSRLEFSLPDCPPTEAPFLRLRFDCPTPGALSADCDPSVRSCYSGTWENESMRLWCDVGEYCGRLPFAPCDWCSMQNMLAASFDPRSLEVTLPPGGLWSGQLSLWGWADWCPGAPECGEGYGSCFNGLAPDVPWLRTTIPSAPGGNRGNVDYNLRIDASGLPPGRHVGNVVSVPGCHDCYESCMTVTLTVQDPAAVEDGALLESVRLDGPYPNPSTERFGYAITVPAPTHARVDLLDVAGRRVAALLDRDLPAGTHDLSWNGSGSAIPSGTYVLRLEANGVRRSRLIVLAR